MKLFFPLTLNTPKYKIMKNQSQGWAMDDSGE